MTTKGLVVLLIFLSIARLGFCKELSSLGGMSTKHHSVRRYVQTVIMLRDTMNSNDYNFYLVYNNSIESGFSNVTIMKQVLAIKVLERPYSFGKICKVSTVRLVFGSFICEIFSTDKKPVIVKINLVGLVKATRTLNDSKIKNNNDVRIMIDESGIWILYQGEKKDILELIRIRDLSPIKRIYIDPIDVDYHTILVYSKLYIMSAQNGTLTIIKAIDTDNPKNTMSHQVILSSNNIPKESIIHYNPRFQQLFVGVSKSKTDIYRVDFCSFSYPKSQDLDLSHIKSTFMWSLVPTDINHYDDIIQSFTNFFDIKDYQTLKYLSSVFLSCPYIKCMNSGMTNIPFCRLNKIRLLLETFANYKDPARYKHIQVRLDILKLLEQSQFRMLFNKLGTLKKSINKKFMELRYEMNSLHSNLGSYFFAMENFDRRTSQSDVELVYKIFNELNGKQENKAFTLKSKLKTLVEQATGSNAAEIAGQIANTTVAFGAFANPFSIFDASGNILDVRDRLSLLAKSFVEFEKLGVITRDYIPHLSKIGDSLRTNIHIMLTKFPNIKSLVTKAMNKKLSEHDLEKYTFKFLKEYDSYRPPFQVSTINEYEATLSQIIDELCRIIYSGTSLSSAIAQGVLASKGTCLATKLDVQTLMGLYKDIYDKQDTLLNAMTSAMRAAIGRQNAKKIKDIPGKMSKGQFEKSRLNYKISALEIYINSEVHILSLILDACTLLEYKNGGVMPDYCKAAIDNPIDHESLYDNVLVSAMFNKDMCEMDAIERYVYIPAMQQSANSKIPTGTLDLTSLYRGYETVFQIPNEDWLIKNNWIFDDERNKMIVLKKFELFVPANSSSEINVKSSTRYLSRNIIRPGGDVYDFNAPDLYKYNFRYSQGSEQCTLQHSLPTTPYEFHSCPKLPSICILSEGKTSFSPAYPSVYSKFGIKLSTSGRIIEPKPKTDFFLMAAVKICFVDSKIQIRKTQKDFIQKEQRRYVKVEENPEWKRAPVCCGNSNKYFDRLSDDKKCKMCPNGSKPQFGGYYCEEIDSN